MPKFTPEEIAEIRTIIREETPAALRKGRIDELPPEDNDVLKWDASRARMVFEPEALSGSGSGTMTTVKDSGTQRGDADIVTLDFRTGLDVVEDPNKEVNVSINEAEIVHDSLSGGTSTDAHHPQSHNVVGHSDTIATGPQLNNLTDGTNADPLHTHSGTGGGVTDHGDLTGLDDIQDHAGLYIGQGLLPLLLDHGLLKIGLTDDDHPQYAKQAQPETVSGDWTWAAPMRFNAGAAPSAPPEDFATLRLIKDGGNLILRLYGPLGTDNCDICTLGNVVTAHVNTLTLNGIE